MRLAPWAAAVDLADADASRAAPPLRVHGLPCRLPPLRRLHSPSAAGALRLRRREQRLELDLHELLVDPLHEHPQGVPEAQHPPPSLSDQPVPGLVVAVEGVGEVGDVDQTFDEDLLELHKQPERYDPRDVPRELLPNVGAHVLRLFPPHDLALGLLGAPLGERAALREVLKVGLRERADEVVGTGGMRYCIALGLGFELKDVFRRTKNMTIVHSDFRFEENERWSWQADKHGPIPLNVRLKAYANENSYRLALTDHEPMRMGDPAAEHPFTIPWAASVQKTRNGQVQLSCAGTAEVKSPRNFPAHVFGPAPEALLAYDGGHAVLRGERSWVERTSELGVAHASIAECKERLPPKEGGVLLPEKSVRKTLTWTLRRLGEPTRP